jgi:threonine aldolase
VETNFVLLDVAPLGLAKSEVLRALRDVGVGLSGNPHPTRLRAVTHLDLTDEDIDAAVELAPHALGVHV